MNRLSRIARILSLALLSSALLPLVPQTARADGLGTSNVGPSASRATRIALYQAFIEARAADGFNPMGVGGGCKFLLGVTFVEVTGFKAINGSDCRVPVGSPVVIVYTTGFSWLPVEEGTSLSRVDTRLGTLSECFRWAKVSVDDRTYRPPLLLSEPFTVQLPDSIPWRGSRTMRVNAYAFVLVLGTLPVGIHTIDTVIDTGGGPKYWGEDHLTLTAGGLGL